MTFSPEQLTGLARLMTRAGNPPQRALSVTPLPGGRSNLMYVLDDGSSRWVLRTPPRAGRTPSAHDVSREYRVAKALQRSAVPVAEPVLLHEDDDLLGVPFTIAAFVEGRAYRTQAELHRLDPGRIGAIVGSVIGTLADVHRVDCRAAGLGSFGRPQGYSERQVSRWTRQWEAVGDPRWERLAQGVISRLQAQVPADGATVLVHGDYRIDNTLISDEPGSAEVAAVVDWELSTIGDPVADVALMCAYRDPAFDLIAGAPSAWTSPELPSVEELTAGYVAAGGHPLQHWEFHVALAYFKVAVIAALIEHRRRAGASDGPGFDTAREAVPRFLELARAELRPPSAGPRPRGS